MTTQTPQRESNGVTSLTFLGHLGSKGQEGGHGMSRIHCFQSDVIIRSAQVSATTVVLEKDVTGLRLVSPKQSGSFGIQSAAASLALSSVLKQSNGQLHSH